MPQLYKVLTLYKNNSHYNFLQLGIKLTLSLSLSLSLSLCAAVPNFHQIFEILKVRNLEKKLKM
jgi:hypothetical protein